jgi:hypothetical protein
MAFGGFEPGPVGTVEGGARKRETRSRTEIVVRFVLAAVLLALWLNFLLGNLRPGSSILVRLSVTAIYLLIAYAVHPVADTSNLGWFGGLMNNPFRFSDNINRLLVFLMIFLWPGRLVSESFVDMARAFSLRGSH